MFFSCFLIKKMLRERRERESPHPQAFLGLGLPDRPNLPQASQPASKPNPLPCSIPAPSSRSPSPSRCTLLPDSLDPISPVRRATSPLDLVLAASPRPPLPRKHHQPPPPLKSESPAHPASAPPFSMDAVGRAQSSAPELLRPEALASTSWASSSPYCRRSLAPPQAAHLARLGP